MGSDRVASVIDREMLAWFGQDRDLKSDGYTDDQRFRATAAAWRWWWSLPEVQVPGRKGAPDRWAREFRPVYGLPDAQTRAFDWLLTLGRIGLVGKDLWAVV